MTLSPWMPELIEVEKYKIDGSDAAYFSNFGWEQLEVPDDCPLVGARMAWLKTRFDERYAYRMLGQESMERWQVKLQSRFDEVVYKYERAYSIYDTNSTEMLADVVDGEKETLTNEIQASGQDVVSNLGETRNIDTPDTPLNESESYADSITKTTAGNTATYGRKDTTQSTRVRTITGTSMIESINNNIDQWRDIDTEFVKEFENNFLNVFWY